MISSSPNEIAPTPRLSARYCQRSCRRCDRQSVGADCENGAAPKPVAAVWLAPGAAVPGAASGVSPGVPPGVLLSAGPAWVRLMSPCAGAPPVDATGGVYAAWKPAGSPPQRIRSLADR